MKLLLTLLLSSFAVLAQVTTSLTGTITDPQGAAVPGAQVKVINRDTNATAETVSNDRGEYAVDLPGRTTTDVTVTYTGKRDDRDFGSFPATPVELPGWTRTDLGFTRPVLNLSGAHFDLLLRLENALGSSHEEIANFPAPGRSLTIGLRAASLRR